MKMFCGLCSYDMLFALGYLQKTSRHDRTLEVGHPGNLIPPDPLPTLSPMVLPGVLPGLYS